MGVFGAAPDSASRSRPPGGVSGQTSGASGRLPERQSDALTESGAAERSGAASEWAAGPGEMACYSAHPAGSPQGSRVRAQKQSHAPAKDQHTPCLFTGDALQPNWPFGDHQPWSFDLIMADPPWRFELWSTSPGGRLDEGDSPGAYKKSAQAQYATMTLDDIAALPVSDLGRDDCLLWLWATAPMLPAQIALMERWGFTFKTSGVWVKTTVNEKIAFGTGYVLRNAHEPFLIGTRGEPKTARDVRSVVMGRSREHSRKPDSAFKAAEALMPGARRIELFSRETRPGWATWGNEAGLFDAAPDTPSASRPGAGVTGQTGEAVP